MNQVESHAQRRGLPTVDKAEPAQELSFGRARLKHPLIFCRDINESGSRMAIPEGIVEPA
jgi:hypothetical protein